MNRLARLLLLVAWLIGVISGSLPAGPDSRTPPKSSYVVTHSDWGRLAVRNDEIVLRVGLGDTYWQMTTPVPAFVGAWLCDDERVAPFPRTPPPERALFIPL